MLVCSSLFREVFLPESKSSVTVPAKSFGQQVGAFFEKALPAGKDGYVLAVAEAHNQSTHLKLFKENWGFLASPQGSNVTRLGIEDDAHLNVFFWALREGKLPVAKQDAQAYVQSILVNKSADNLKHNVKLYSDLLLTAAQSGVDVVAFDGRGIYRYEYSDNSALAKAAAIVEAEIPKDAAARQALRTDPEAFKRWQNAVAPKLATLVNAPGEAVGVYWMIVEAREIMRVNPEYQRKMQPVIDQARANHRLALEQDDALAAEWFTKDRPRGNAISISGRSHITGAADEKDKVQGTFAAHLERNGLKVTSVSILSAREFDKTVGFYSPLGGGYSEYLNACRSRNPMHLVLPEQDVVLDISDPSQLTGLKGWWKLLGTSPQVKAAVQKLVESDARLTCDQESLPTGVERAAQEAAKNKSVLSRKP